MTSRSNDEHDRNETSNAASDDAVCHASNRNGSSSPDPLSTYERWSKLPKTRGRQPRDPHGRSARFQCRDVDDMETFLRDYLVAPTIPAEHATLEFVFPVSSAFMVYAADFKNFKKPTSDGDRQTHHYGKYERTAISVIDALAPTEDSKDKMRRQKAIAKICVEACEKADGFRYSFHNNWLSREDEACRFSYFCNDSTLNKGRAANEGAGMQGKKMRKPVYNCQGLIAVKFSFTKQSLEVHYKHVPLHKTYAERAPPPRKDSKRRRLMYADDPDASAHLIGVQRKGEKGLAEAINLDRLGSSSATAPGGVDSSHDSAEAVTEDVSLSLTANTGSRQNAVAVSDGLAGSAIVLPNEILSNQTDQAAHGGRAIQKPRRPAIPGTMAGSVQGGNLNWRPSTNNNRKMLAQNTRKLKARTLTSTADEASASEKSNDTNVPMSELEALKQKLAQAEERIKRLESEKSTVPQTAPSQHMFWSPPPGYSPALPPYPLQSLSPAYGATQAPPVQLRFQPPPQRPFPETPDDQSSSTPTQAPASATNRTPSAPQAAVQKPASTRPAGTKFVLYTPKAKPKRMRG